MPPRSQAAILAFALTIITMGVNLHVPLYPAIAALDGRGLAATTVAFSFYVAGILPVLLALAGLPDRIGYRPVIIMALLLSGTATGLMAMSPHISTLAVARLLLGVGTALMSATALAYMSQIGMSQPLPGKPAGAQASHAASWVAASTSLGFGLGPFVTTLTLYFTAAPGTLVPPSYIIHMSLVLLAGLLLWQVSGRMSEAGKPLSSPAVRMLRLPAYPPGALWFGLAIALAWATTGIIISVLPAMLAQYGMAKWSGTTTLLAVSCGLLFQPAARRCQPHRAVTIGLLTLLPAFVILAFGALRGQLLLVLLGALMASSACYGFVYLGGLAGVAALADEGNHAQASKASVSAGFFMLAYVGFSLPVVFTGALADAFGKAAAMTVFGGFLVLGVAALLWWRRPRVVLGKVGV
ncbi:MFS transporter [Undibacterium sp. TJN19]|uniref:MFS transporter n=1 Tax=Undibacterium sp. TJN19 TaxID=3413055 RepID=UPI003BEFC073